MGPSQLAECCLFARPILKAEIFEAKEKGAKPEEEGEARENRRVSSPPLSQLNDRLFPVVSGLFPLTTPIQQTLLIGLPLSFNTSAPQPPNNYGFHQREHCCRTVKCYVTAQLPRRWQ